MAYEQNGAECIDCGSRDTMMRRDGTGLCKCRTCGAYFEVEDERYERERRNKRFDDDDRW